MGIPAWNEMKQAGPWQDDSPERCRSMGLEPTLRSGPPPLDLGAVTLRFASRAAGSATLDLFDVQGRKVLHMTAVAGDGLIRSLDWEPESRLAGGVYFAVLSAGGERVSRKLVFSR